MRTYTTIQGDMWDSVAHTQLGNDKHICKLMDANRKYHDYYIFPAGIVLTLPDINPELSDHIPPWKKVAG